MCAFIPRDAKGYAIKEAWDVLGMNTTRSDDVVLDNVSFATLAAAGSTPQLYLGARGLSDKTTLGIDLGKQVALALSNYHADERFATLVQ